MSEGAGEGSGRAKGVGPGALSALLAEVAAAPEVREVDPVSLPPGTLVGRFEIIRELGRGGFGVVYETKDRELGRPVAVKLVRAGRITEEEGKVSREAEAIARLSHPNLITLHEVGRSEHGPFLVFEFLRGKTLDLRIEEGPMPVHEAVHVATEIARGLAHAHAEGVVHRDLKPANVFVTSKGQVKILDFGMAHAFGRRRLSGGTPAYMAPEQWEDDPEDERTDVFALGVMLYRMLTGEYPFPEGEGRWAAEPATPRKLDVPGAPELSDLVERMLDRTPKVRPRDGAAVLAALTPIEEKLRAKPADGAPPVHAKKQKATFGDLLAELKRRHVFRVVIGYGVLAFAVLQVVEPIMHGAELPDWTLKAVLVVLALGFPVSVILAWVYDLTAQGVRRTPSAPGPGAPSFGRSRLLVPLAVSAAVLAIAAVGAGAWYASKRAAGHRSVESGGAGPSIAVLPFQDLSPEHDQEYFSDGMAEEILSRLSKVKGLRVPGRVSSFHFKGKGVEPAVIAEKLRVTHLLEGSVRRSGNRLRIRAEVVRARDGESVWSQTFDRDLTDVLAVQDEIARSAVRELAPMLLAEAPPPPAAGSVDPEAYRLYLLGLYLFAQDSIGPALEALERSAALAPRFAPTQAYLAAAASFAQRGARREESLRLAKTGWEAAERAVALDPSSPLGYVSRGWYRMGRDWDWKGASEDLERALSIDPANVWALNTRAILAQLLGRSREAVDLQLRAVNLDPLNVVTTVNLAGHLAAAGRFAEARVSLQRAREISPGSESAARTLGYVALGEGKAEEALVEFERVHGPDGIAGKVAALHLLGRERESREGMALLERNGSDSPFFIAGARAWTGDADGAFAALDRAAEVRDPRLTSLNASLLLRPLRGDPRWNLLRRRMNLPIDGEPGGVTPSDAAVLPSIAVLPFADMSPKHDQEYFADGVAEEIRNALARVEGLKVIGRTSSSFFKGKEDDLKAIGQKLGVTNVLEGSLRKDGNGIRITAQLVRVADGAHIWSESYDRELSGIFKIQEEVARSVVEVLKVKLIPRKGGGPSSVRTASVEAYQLYLLSRSIQDQGGRDAHLRSVEPLERALRLDPGFALAHVWLAVAFSNLAQMESGPETLRLHQRSREAMERAVELDPQEASVYAVRAWRRMLDWDWKGAERDLDRADALHGGDVLPLAARAGLLYVMGRYEEAAAVGRRAFEIDPLSAVLAANLVRSLRNAGRLDEARAMANRALEISPGYEDAIEEQAVLDLLEERPEIALRGFERLKGARRVRGIAVAFHALGRERESVAALSEMERDPGQDPYLIAGIHAYRGDQDGALRWLEKAYERHDPSLVWVKAAWPLRSLRGDPRFVALLRKMNLPVD